LVAVLLLFFHKRRRRKKKEMFYGFNKHCGVKCVGEQTEKKGPALTGATEARVHKQKV